MRVYSIKYILTRGILEHEGGELVKFDHMEYYSHEYTESHLRVFEQIGRECFFTRDEARAAGLTKVSKAIVSTHKRLKKLERLADSLS